MGRAVQRIGSLLAAFAIVLFSTQLAFGAAADVGIRPGYPDKDNSRSSTIFIMTLEPGETGKNGVKLVNNGDEKRTVQIYAVDGSSSVDGSFSCRQKTEQKKEVGSWVDLSADEVSINPGETKIVDFTVTVPEGANPGEHNGCIAVQDIENLPAQSGEGIRLGIRSAIRLAVTVPGEIVKKLEIKSINIRANGDVYDVMPLIHNAGNVSLDVKPYIQLESIFGQKTEVKGEGTCPIVPGATLECGYSFERPYWGGFYRAHVSVGYNADLKDGIGENVNKQTRIRQESAYFFAAPDPLALLAEVVVLAAIVWAVVAPFRRRLRRRRLMRTWEKYVVQDPAETIMSIAAARGVKWRKIAKANRLKAPYMLTVGKPIIVPKLKATKPKKPRKKRQSELDWFLDDEPVAPTQSQAEQQPPAVVADAPLVPPITPAPAEPTPAPKSEPVPAPAPAPVAPQDDWSNPSYEAAVPVDEDYADWREGADASELQDIEQRLGDYTAVPRMKTQSAKPAPKPAKKKPAAKKTTRSKKKS